MIDEEKLKSARKIYPALDWIMNKPSDEDFECLARTIDFNIVKGDKKMAEDMIGYLSGVIIALQLTFKESVRSYYWTKTNKEG